MEPTLSVGSLSKRHQRLTLDPDKFAGKSRRGFTPEQVAECRELFQIFDKNGDGEIDRAEFLPMMKALGLNLSVAELEMFFSRMDSDASGTLEFEELVHFLEGISQPITLEQEMQEAFEFFNPDELEIDPHETATAIHPRGLAQIFAEMGEEISELECQEMISAATGGKDWIDFKTFQRFCKPKRG
eukprot:CAMPEP_0181509144 /NCGR_PEP_ID=MMETSP1110-20121109/60177_1 /TAXON_ID=174948 /ORGANISM="Symbiodinium sp., Strain CCMP421" /LENGTH=185 /DNA_ID=CAMNT_0023638661 /DNA_START=36 /DNA_END=590 /DNA_ORIENTATION=-